MAPINKGKTLSARLLAQLLTEIGAIGECYIGTCDAGMAASKTTIVSADMKGYGDDYFNKGWELFIVHNNASPGALPQGETRDITDYVDATGTFTTVDFSANVRENDEFIVARLTSFPLDNMILSADPVDGSLASFISSGNGSTTLGTRLGVDVSIIDVLGHTGVIALTTGIYGNIGDFAGQTHLQTLLAALGIPDVSDKSFYTCLVTDRLDNGTFGLAALDTDLGTINTKLGIPADAAGISTVFARLKQIVDTYLADATIGLSNIKSIIDGIKSKTDLMNSALGTGTLNDANVSDTIVPGSLPTNMHITFDINNLNNNGDDFDIEVKVGAAASERVVAYYNLTSDGTNITADKGSGTGSVIKQRRIDISDVLVYTGEQVVVELTKNSATDRNVVYKYICGV